MHSSKVLVSDRGGNVRSADVICNITCGGTQQTSRLYMVIILMNTGVKKPQVRMQVTSRDTRSFYCGMLTLDLELILYCIEKLNFRP